MQGRCILLGYGEQTKGYRLYDPVKKRVFFSRDVSFNEEERSIECDSEESGGDQYLELDLSNEEVSATDLEPLADIQPSVPPAPVPPALEQQPLRCSGRERHFPDYYGIRVYVCKTEPTTVKEVLSTPEKDQLMVSSNGERNEVSKGQ